MRKQLILTFLALCLWGSHAALVPAKNGAFERISEAAVLEDTIPLLKRSDLYSVPLSKQLPTRLADGGDILSNPIDGPVFLNVFEMMRGRIPGVWVSGGYFNYRIRIRGAMNPPLVILDGMPFYGFTDQRLNDVLINLPPLDVDYIEVYKNIAQTTIYGPGAGNGVIIIHTRSGEPEN